ncbi:MAG: hypothetical protein LUG13_01365 [Oscillospiraceae bacterium]|nr:hypothetical protein [Oscillospiraceae bacterium]
MEPPDGFALQAWHVMEHSLDDADEAIESGCYYLIYRPELDLSEEDVAQYISDGILYDVLDSELALSAYNMETGELDGGITYALQGVDAIEALGGESYDITVTVDPPDGESMEEVSLSVTVNILAPEVSIPEAPDGFASYEWYGGEGSQFYVWYRPGIEMEEDAAAQYIADGTLSDVLLSQMELSAYDVGTNEEIAGMLYALRGLDAVIALPDATYELTVAACYPGEIMAPEGEGAEFSVTLYIVASETESSPEPEPDIEPEPSPQVPEASASPKPFGATHAPELAAEEVPPQNPAEQEEEMSVPDVPVEPEVLPDAENPATSSARDEPEPPVPAVVSSPVAGRTYAAADKPKPARTYDVAERTGEELTLAEPPMPLAADVPVEQPEHIEVADMPAPLVVPEQQSLLDGRLYVVMGAASVVAAAVFIAILVPDVKVLRWYREKRRKRLWK